MTTVKEMIEKLQKVEKEYGNIEVVIELDSGVYDILNSNEDYFIAKLYVDGSNDLGLGELETPNEELDYVDLSKPVKLAMVF